jgi:hypothetical protein
MVDEIALLKQLQADVNTAFDGFFKLVQESPGNSGAIAVAKERIGTVAQITSGTALGPAFSILGLSSQVSSRLNVGNLK